MKKKNLPSKNLKYLKKKEADNLPPSLPSNADRYYTTEEEDSDRDEEEGEGEEDEDEEENDSNFLVDSSHPIIPPSEEDMPGFSSWTPSTSSYLNYESSSSPKGLPTLPFTIDLARLDALLANETLCSPEQPSRPVPQTTPSPPFPSPPSPHLPSIPEPSAPVPLSTETSVDAWLDAFLGNDS